MSKLSLSDRIKHEIADVAQRWRGLDPLRRMIIFSLFVLAAHNIYMLTRPEIPAVEKARESADSLPQVPTE